MLKIHNLLVGTLSCRTVHRSIANENALSFDGSLNTLLTCIHKVFLNLTP